MKPDIASLVKDGGDLTRSRQYEPLASPSLIESRIFIIRGHRVMMDRHLAEMYGVETRVLSRTVKRNIQRFPDDFMFQLTAEEWANLKCQFGTSRWGGDRRALPRAFTEQGVAMLSGILNSRRAVQVNIEIMRAFVRLRRFLSANRDVSSRLEELERRVASHDTEIRGIFEAIRQLMEPPEEPEKRIGFRP